MDGVVQCVMSRRNVTGAHCKVPRQGRVGGVGDEVKAEPLQDKRLGAQHRLFILLKALAELLCSNVCLLYLDQPNFYCLAPATSHIQTVHGARELYLETFCCSTLPAR